MRQYEIAVTGEPLADMLGQSDVRPEQMLAWAADIAEALSRLHAAGFVHGSVDLENIRIADSRASLTTSHNSDVRTQSDDSLQFGDVLLAMAASLACGTSEPQTRLSSALERLARQYLQPESEALAVDMRKIAMALRLLRFEPARVKPASAPVSNRPQTKMMILFRVVPPEPIPAAPVRKRVPFWRMFWMIVLPAGLLTAAGTTLCYVVR